MSHEVNLSVRWGTGAWTLALLFIALKLTGHVTWSWVWVLSPLWILWFGGLLITFICFVIIKVLK